jgi:hypothetical protein
VAVCRCRACGARQVTRSRFEIDCDDCGGDGTLVPEDAYDPEPDELRCSHCAYVVEGAGFTGERDEEYSGGLTVDDPCPRCGRELVPPTAMAERGRRSSAAVREQPHFALARAAAQKVLENHWTGEMPVDVRRIAEALGLTVIVGPFRHQGMLRDVVIEVPESESRVAQRFAIAHEIGHHELRHQVNEDKIEPEANAFASELLIPRRRLRRAVELGLTLAELRELFVVSREAMIHALEDAKLLSKVAG